MARNVRRIGSSVLLASIFAACSSTRPPIALDCGPASTLVSYPTTPELKGAPIGPLLIRAPYASEAKDATALGFKRGEPFKTIVLVARVMETDVTLTGARCSDGQPLRFWMNKGGTGGIWRADPGGTPIPDDVLTAAGDLRAVVPQLDPIASGSIAYVGYMLFPTAGAYRIEGFAGDRKIGQATIVVSAAPFPLGQ